MLLRLRLALLGGAVLRRILGRYLRLELRETDFQILRLVTKTVDLIAQGTELDLASGAEISQRLADPPSEAACILALEPSRERAARLGVAKHLQGAHGCL